jgi:predicted PurR-regulated permease PerM
MIFFGYLGILSIILLAGYITWPFLPAFVWALIIYQAGLPLQRRLQQRFSTVQTSLLMLLLVILTIIVPLSLVGGQLVIEASAAYQRLEAQGFTTPSAESLRQLILSLPLPVSLRDYVSGDNLEETLLVHAAEFGKTVVTFTSALLARAAINIGGFLFSVVAFLFLYFCICSEGPAWYKKISRAVPTEYDITSLLTRLASGASGLFWGVAGTCLAQGIVGGFIFLLLGLPSPLLITALISFCALIPVIGTAIIWAPFVLWLAISGAWVKAIILALCGIFVIGSMDNITRPLLTKISGAQLSTLTVTLGAIGGLTVFGLTGLVIGPLVIESFSWLLDRLGKTSPEEGAGQHL